MHIQSVSGERLMSFLWKVPVANRSFPLAGQLLEKVTYVLRPDFKVRVLVEASTGNNLSNARIKSRFRRVADSPAHRHEWVVLAAMFSGAVPWPVQMFRKIACPSCISALLESKSKPRNYRFQVRCCICHRNLVICYDCTCIRIPNNPRTKQFKEATSASFCVQVGFENVSLRSTDGGKTWVTELWLSTNAANDRVQQEYLQTLGWEGGSLGANNPLPDLVGASWRVGNVVVVLKSCTRRRDLPPNLLADCASRVTLHATRDRHVDSGGLHRRYAMRCLRCGSLQHCVKAPTLAKRDGVVFVTTHVKDIQRLHQNRRLTFNRTWQPVLR
jgi:hypothetical protein